MHHVRVELNDGRKGIEVTVEDRLPTSLRNDYLDKLSRDIQGTTSKEAVEEYWETIKAELQAYRMFVGIEYESLIAGLIDRKMASPPGHEV